MLKLDVITRGNANPQGKSRVYLSCTKGDFDKYFETVKNDIFSYQNCAIWYYREDVSEREKEQYLSDIAEMQLLVVPVTNALLKGSSRTKEIDIPFAEEKNIPILPIVVERCQVEDINALFGNIQYLDKTEEDDTVLSYEEKLKKFLEEVLIGDELAEKIRNAFDAYVFLSYRKKDRKYAKELMNLIHENDFCRDIAIWYDEFLVPGENFNEAIRQALEKSDLFALAVTPNLVNEENYVMSTEYPMAKKSGKPVLPAEMVPTEHGELKNKYENIPEPTDAHNKEALSSALMQALSGVAKRENDNDPQHNFFIGLAYLGGIDMEVNHEKALQLIEGAAKNGFPDAIKKLVAMYRKGDGVKRDYQKAINWQIKYIDSCKKIYDEKKDEQPGYNWFYAVEDLGSYYEELFLYDKAQDVYIELLKIGETLAKNHNTWTADRCICRAAESLGTIYREKGNDDEAIKYYEKSIEVSRNYAEQVGSVTARNLLARAYDQTGKIYKGQGKIDKALDYCNKALVMREYMAEQDKTNFVKSRLSYSRYSVANIYKQEGNYDKAIEFYQKAVDGYKEVYSEEKTEYPKRMIAACYLDMAKIYAEEGQVEKAERLYREAIVLREEIAESTGTPETYSALARAYARYGIYLKDISDYDKAEQYQRKALDIVNKQVETSPTYNGYRKQGDIYVDISNIYSKRKMIDQEIKYLQEAQQIYEKAKEISPTLAVEDDLRLVYYNTGLTYRKEGKTKLALEYMEKVIEISNKLVKEAPSHTHMEHLSSAYTQIAIIYGDMRMKDEAKEEYAKALEIREKIYEEAPVTKYAIKYAAAINNFGDACPKTNDKNDKSGKYYAMAVDVLEKHLDSAGNMNLLKELASSYNCLGNYNRRLKNYLKAEELFKKALTLRKKIAAKDEAYIAKASIAGCYDNLGKLNKNQKKYQEAIDYYKKSLEIYKEIAKSTMLYSDLAKCSSTYYNIGDIKEAQQNYPEAIENYDKAREICEKVITKNEKRLYREKLGNCYRHLGTCCYKNKEFEKAEQWQKKAIITRKENYENNKNDDTLHYLLVVYEECVETLRNQKKYSEAKAFGEEAISLCPSPGARSLKRDIASIKIKIGVVLLKEGKPKDGLEYINESLKLRCEADKEKSTTASRFDISCSYFFMASAYLELGNKKEAINYYKKSLNIRQKLAKENAEKYKVHYENTLKKIESLKK